MELHSLRLVHFKNHHKREFTFPKGWICFTGKNGIGKTNILDAIWYLANSRSYFNAQDQQLIAFQQPGFSLQSVFHTPNPTQINSVCPFGKRKQISINDKWIQKISDYIGLIPMVMITPFDIQLVFEGGEARRKWMDSYLCKVFPDYLIALDKYKKGLEMRNKQLKLFKKNGLFDKDLLWALNKILCDQAPIIHEYRQHFVHDLSQLFHPFYNQLSGNSEVPQMEYESPLNTNTMDHWLLERQDKDLMLERTTKGIHTDDMLLYLNHNELKKFGSQGQIKSYVIAMQLAVFSWLKQHKKTTPILLLDDIFEKIDHHRAQALMNGIQQLQVQQVFLTDTHRDRVRQHLSDAGIDYHLIHLE
jgi:DNA replication and repair protein RecF